MTEIKAENLFSEMKIEIKIKNMGLMKLRLFVGIFFIKIAGYILKPIEIEIIKKEVA